MFLIPIYYFFPNKKAYPLSENRLYPVRNNAPLGFESQRLEFLTRFTLSKLSIKI